MTAVWPAHEEGTTTRVLMSGPDVEEGRSLAVFVDPYTAQIRGALPSYGSSGALPLRTWLSELHRDLHLGEPGRVYSELAASWMGSWRSAASPCGSAAGARLKQGPLPAGGRPAVPGAAPCPGTAPSACGRPPACSASPPPA